MVFILKNLKKKFKFPSEFIKKVFLFLRFPVEWIIEFNSQNFVLNLIKYLGAIWKQTENIGKWLKTAPK